MQKQDILWQNGSSERFRNATISVTLSFGLPSLRRWHQPIDTIDTCSVQWHSSNTLTHLNITRTIISSDISVSRKTLAFIGTCSIRRQSMSSDWDPWDLFINGWPIYTSPYFMPRLWRSRPGRTSDALQRIEVGTVHRPKPLLVHGGIFVIFVLIRCFCYRCTCWTPNTLGSWSVGDTDGERLGQ